MMFSVMIIMLIFVSMTGVMHTVKCKELTVEVGVRTRANAKRAACAGPRRTPIRRYVSSWMAQASRLDCANTEANEGCGATA